MTPGAIPRGAAHRAGRHGEQRWLARPPVTGRRTDPRPPLTTIDMNLAEIGRIAALRLLDAIDTRPAPGVHTVPCRLVVRESS
ncbi:substrate-binding domain-containing protein [Streptomyces sp. TP-A0356]|uniref:substrate-binding domain-containing protein n=1 Tax=Streptomyces sp. TP-A0356 TaxID=1359208 RepID=UPI0022771482|nr:substrate-binding domain-containing protein [Streptomyces sp. TP-A0356]